MKVYFLHLTQDDFVSDDNVWTSGSIDLYDNDSYRNFSTTKSDYGLNSLGNKTWTGLEQTGSLTDSGIIVGDRFLDTTGRISLFRWEVETSELPGLSPVSTKLDVYTSDDELQDFPEEWASRTNVLGGESIFVFNADRYAKFVLTFTSDQDVSGIEFDFYVKVEIERPVIAPLFQRTKEILKKFPEWMSMREHDILDSENPETATPTSLGSHLINAVAGEWLTELDKDLDWVHLQQFINTADVNQTAWVYRTDSVPYRFISIKGDGVELARTASLEEFYELTEDEDGFWMDPVKGAVFTNKLYEILEVDGEEYSQHLQHVWNWFDEHGAIVDIHRHRAESNEIFRKRILDVYKNKPGVGLNAFKLALRRELNLWLASDGATPDSDYLGATPEIYEIHKLEHATDFTDYDGMPTQSFISLVSDLVERFPTTWGYFKWNNARWDMGGTDNKGYAILPYRYDATPTYPIQGGIGDGDDLFIYRPDAVTGPQEFNARLKIRGRHRVDQLEYPKLTFDATLQVFGETTFYVNTPLVGWFTVIAETATETYYLPVPIEVTSDASAQDPTGTESAHKVYSFLGSDGNARADDIWYDSAGWEYGGNSATPFTIDFDQVTALSVQWGRWDPTIGDFTDYPVTDSGTLWFASDEVTTLSANSADTPLVSGFPTEPDPVVVRSDNYTVEPDVQVWGDSTSFEVVLNGIPPTNATENVTISIPVLNLPNVNPGTKGYRLSLTSVDENDVPAARTTDVQGNDLYLDSSYISVNGDNGWVDDELIIDGNVALLEFASEDGAEYPITGDGWELFEAQHWTTIPGIVDENGPWRNGKPQPPGANNFNFLQIDTVRFNFDIPQTEDYVVTWMGVDIEDNPRVIAWLDSNTVVPIDAFNPDIYPDGAIIEAWDDDLQVYYYSGFILRVRLVNKITPEWNPQIHSGWYYQNEDERYVYADPITETATMSTWVLDQVARQGAPIIVKSNEATPKEYRQVAFSDATPNLTLTNVQVLPGTGTNKLFLAYEDVFDVVVTDLTAAVAITADTESTTNIIETNDDTDIERSYEVQYKLNRSFYADHEYIDFDNKNKTRLVFTESGAPFNNYTVHYEGSDYNPATPIDMPLNSFYTTMDEGFIFLSHDEYSLATIEIRLSPSAIVADGEDYLLVSIRSIDQHGNPKPNQTFNIATDWGTLDDSSVTTDRDGFGVTVLTSENNTTSMTGTVTITGAVNGSATFDISPTFPLNYKLSALPSTDSMEANGESSLVVYGKVEDENHDPVPYAQVNYRRGRSVKELFEAPYIGQVETDERGVFSVGPIVSATPNDPGLWFMSLESWYLGASPGGIVATPNYATPNEATPADFGPIGDVVFWNEFPDHRFGVNAANDLPVAMEQMKRAPNEHAFYSRSRAFPVYHDDATPYAGATPTIDLGYRPPRWYAINRYTQYQLGLLGTDYNQVDLDKLQDSHPDYKDH